MSQAPVLSPIEEVAEFFASGPSREEIARFQLSAAAQEYINQLPDKEDDGTLTPEEQKQLDELMLLNDVITLIRSHITDDSTEAGDTQGAAESPS